MTGLSVFKYPLQVLDEQAISLPLGAKVLAVRFQRQVPMLWALVDPAEREERFHVIRMAGTGHPVEASWADKYVSTDFLHDGGLVFHFFAGIVVPT